MADQQTETRGDDETSSNDGLPPLAEVLKSIYFDPVVWLIIVVGFVIMHAAGTVPGAVAIMLFTTVYFMVREEFP